MPRTKLDKPKYPPINQLRAAILERKFVSRMSWADLAAGTGITETTMRHLAASKPPEEWPVDVRAAVCRKLGISIKVAILDDYGE